MLRRIALLSLLAILFLPLGCMTNRPTIYSWPHWKRHFVTVLEDFHEFHMDFDRVIFDMDERPLEDVD